MAPSPNATTLSTFWKHISWLTSTSSPSSIAQITQFFSLTAVVYLTGMGNPPCTNHAELVAAIQTLVSYCAIEEHEIITHIKSQDGRVIVNTMENKNVIMRELLEGFRECEVVTFDEEGRIERYELYFDSSPIVAVLAKANAVKS
jgi:hypothetical protein